MGVGVGLGQLLEGPQEAGRLVGWVLGDETLDFVEDGQISWDSVSAHLLVQAEEGVTPGHDQRAGILGPADVAPDRDTASGQFAYYGNDGLILESMGNFSSFRANTCVLSGKWMYEVTLHTSGIQQLGWCTITCPFTAEEGVGDAPDSYAYDGKRNRKWSVKASPYGQTWAAGDVIGCCLDLDAGEMSFYRNGTPLGVAFSGIRKLQHTQLAFFPAASISYAEKCELNFGGLPFQYPVEGFQPLQHGPSPQESALASHLTSSLARLSRLCVDPSVAAADSAANPPTSHPLPPSSSPSSSGFPTYISTGAHALGGAAAQGGMGREGGSTSSNSSAYGGGVTEATYMGAGLGMDEQKLQQGEGRGVGGSSSSSSGGGGMAWTDVLLLARAICEHLGPLLVGTFVAPSSSQQPMAVDGESSTASTAGAGPRSRQCSSYHVGGALLQTLMGLHGRGEPHAPGPTLLLMQLLHLTLPQRAFTQVARALLECLAGRAASAPLKSDQFPYSAAYPWLSLVSCLIQLQPLRTAWFSHPDLQMVLERCLTRKPPSTDDLRTLLPMVWWPGCNEEGASREGMEEAMAKFSATLAKVESRQVCIVAWLAGRSATGLDPSAREDALLTFLRGLVLKNRGATRDVPPPGLSDPTVLISVFSALLRLLRPALAHTTSLPAGDMFVKNTSRGDADPSNELTRLGGIVSHLKREHPLSPQELEPLWLAPSELPPPDVAQEVAAQPALRSCPGILRDSAAPHTMQGAGTASFDSGMLSAGGVADQQQGWLQSLHPCARLLLGCGAVCSSGDVIAGAEGEDCGPEWGLLARFKRSWVPELINTALILYSWRVGLSLKTVSTISNNLSASIQNLNEVERQMSRVQQQQQREQEQQQQQQAAAAAAGEEEDWAPDIERREGGLGTEAGRRRGRQTPGQQLQEMLNYLQEARNVLREDVSSNVRYMRLLKAVFFSGWKREALLALSGWLSRGLLASSDKGALLGYMPSVYMEVVMDVMNTLCKSDDEDLSQLLLRSVRQPSRIVAQASTEPQGGPEPMDTTGPGGEQEGGGPQGYTPALLDSVHMLVGVLADPRIAHPDAKEQIMATLTSMLGHRIILGAVEEVELHPRAGKGPRLVPMVLKAFDSQDWHPITNLLKRIIAGHGFGRQGLHAGTAVAKKMAGLIRPGSRQGSGPYPSPVLQGMLADVLLYGGGGSKRFLNRLFSTLGWALTEFSVTVADLWEATNPAPPPPLPPAVAASIGSSTARRPPPQQHMLTEQQQLRRAGLMFDLAVTLLHVLEFVACAAPHTFLASEVNMGRLMEVLPFALSHFAAGPDARRLSLLLQQYGGSGDGGSSATAQQHEAQHHHSTPQQRDAAHTQQRTEGGGSGSGGSSNAPQQQGQPGGAAAGASTPQVPSSTAASSGGAGGAGGAEGAQPPAQTPATPAGAAPAAPSAPPSAGPAAPTPATPAPLSSILGGLPTSGLVLDASAAAPGGTIADQLAAAVLPSGGGLNLGGGVMLRVVGTPGGVGSTGGLLAGRDRVLGGAGSRAAAVAAAAAAGELGGLGGGGLRGGQRAMERQILVNKVSRAAALAPIVGTLVALWRADKAPQKQQQQQLLLLGGASTSASPSTSFLPSLVSGCGPKLLQDELAYMMRIDWRKAGVEGPTLEEEWADFRQLCADAQEQMRAMEAAQGAAALPEPPDEFVDPITASIMSDPVTLPDSQVTLDRSTVERHLLSQATDPFSRKPLTIAMVVPNTALAARIQRWKATGGKEDMGAA